MQMIAMGTLVVLDHYEDADEGNENIIKKVKESFISMKGNLGI